MLLRPALWKLNRIVNYSSVSAAVGPSQHCRAHTRMLGPPCALVLDGMFSVRPRHRILWLTSRLEFATTVTGTRAGVNGSLNLPSSLAHVGLSAFRLASVTSGGENGHIPHLFGIWYKNRRTGYACFCTRFQGSELVSNILHIKI